MRRLAASTLLLISLALGGCKRARDAVGQFASSAGAVGDTTLHFGQIDTSLLTNGPGWVRRQPGVAPDLTPQQLQAPGVADSAATPADTANAFAAPDTAGRPGRARRDTVADTLRTRSDSLRRPRRDSVPRRRQPTPPDTTVPDTTG